LNFLKEELYILFVAETFRFPFKARLKLKEQKPKSSPKFKAKKLLILN